MNAAVAGALTAATGESWLKICELLHTGKIDVRKLDQEWAKYAPSFMDVARSWSSGGWGGSRAHGRRRPAEQAADGCR